MSANPIDAATPWQVDLPGLINLLSDFTYQSDDVAIRELLSNSADSLTMRWMDEGEQNDPQIHVWIEGENLILQDNGRGMTAQELDGSFSVVAASGKDDELRQELRKQGYVTRNIIGRFGVGRLSVFLIADRMIVETRHCKPDGKGYRWIGTPNGRTIEECPEAEVGCKTILTIKGGHNGRFGRFLVEENLRNIVRAHSRNLPYDIRIGSDKEPANMKRAPWYTESLLDPSKADLYKETCISHLRGLAAEANDWPDAGQPLTVIPLNKRHPVYVFGVLYIPADYSSLVSTGPVVDLYCRGVHIGRDLNLIPREVGFVKGVIEGPDLNPKISRDSVIHDEQFEKVQRVIIDCVLRHLREMRRGDKLERERLSASVAYHRHSFIRGALEKNQTVLGDYVEYVPFRTTNRSESLVTLDDLLSESGSDKISYVVAGFGKGQLDQLLSSRAGDAIIVDTDHEERFVKKFARYKEVECEKLNDLAIIAKEEIEEVDFDELDGWPDIVAFYEDRLEHPEMKLTVKVGKFKRHDIPSLVIPEGTDEERSVLGDLQKTLTTHEMDPRQRREQERKVSEFRKNRPYFLYLNVNNKSMQKLAAVMIDRGDRDTILHEIFHAALIFAEIPLPYEHQWDYHNRVINILCSALTRSESKNEDVTALKQDVISLSTDLKSTSSERDQAVARADQVEQELRDVREQLATVTEEVGRLDKPKNDHIVCFFARPFDDNQNDGARLFDPVETTLREILEDEPYYWELRTGDRHHAHRWLNDGVRSAIHASDCFFVDVSERNPNVYLELGIMLDDYLQRPVFIINEERSEELAAMIEGHSRFQYPNRSENREYWLSQLKTKMTAAFEQSEEMIRLRSAVKDGHKKRFLSKVILKNCVSYLNDEAMKKIMHEFDSIEGLLAVDGDLLVARTKVKKGMATDVLDCVKECYGQI